MQRAALAKGAWISQQQVRDHAVPAPGAPASHDNEILSSNIAGALASLKIKAEGFAYATEPFPQQPAYFKWLKAQLVANHTVVWMIMWNGQKYPAYNMPLPSGVHGHVEPVIGIQSNHDLDTDAAVYDDDVFVHYTDGGNDTVYSVKPALPGDWTPPHGAARCVHGSSYCIGPYSYGWAVQGFLDGGTKPKVATKPLSLAVDPFLREPDFRRGAAPIHLKGTATAMQLSVGTRYEIYRWDSVAAAFEYGKQYVVKTFTASAETFVFEDQIPFWNNGSTYYRCMELVA